MTDEEYAQWKKQILKKSSPIIYNSQQHQAVSFPLSGIGTGSIALGVGGDLREWQLFNRINKEATLPHTFFALWAKEQGKEPVAKRLQVTQKWTPGIEQTEMIGEYPIVEIAFKDSQLPVNASLTAYSPFTPQNARKSSYPVAVFEFQIKNISNNKVQVSFLSTLQNAVGYTGFGPIIGVANPSYGGNKNTVVQKEQYTAIHMTNEQLSPDAQMFGTMTLAVLGKNTKCLAQWDTLKPFWQTFSSTGDLPNATDLSPSKSGRTWNGAIAIPRELSPNETCTITVFIAWHFPNHYVDFSEDYTQYRIGNMYTNWFNDSLAVVDSLSTDLTGLRESTFKFRDTFYDSTLPYYVLDCITSQMSILRSQTLMWLEDGTVAGFEGCGTDRGCCPMNCTHVWNYVQTMAYLFPGLERNIRQIDLSVIMKSNGMVPHRTTIPISLPDNQRDAIDGQCGEILKMYREYLMSLDRKFLDDHWQQLKQAMNYLTDICDTKKQGVIEGEQWNTYDLSLYGSNSFIGSLYLAALRAMEEMAKLENEPQLAAQYHSLFEKGQLLIESMLWNGEYYIQKYDEIQHSDLQYGKGCLSDQVVGQWWAHILNLGYILPSAHINQTLQSIFKYNWRYDFTDFHTDQRIFADGADAGLLNCTWPNGGKPQTPILYCDEVWTGVEYQVGANLIYEGLVELGLQIVKAARDRYNGIKRNPWNEIECGDHYARAMSSWSILLALSGFIHNGPEYMVGFSPKITPDDFKSFFATASAWGSFSQKRTQQTQTDEIAVFGRTLQLRELRFEIPTSVGGNIKRVKIIYNNQPVSSTWSISEQTKLQIKFDSAISVSASEVVKAVIEF